MRMRERSTKRPDSSDCSNAVGPCRWQRSSDRGHPVAAVIGLFHGCDLCLTTDVPGGSCFSAVWSLTEAAEQVTIPRENEPDPRNRIRLTYMMGREGFEPPKAEPAVLQTVPFGRLGTCPHCVLHYTDPVRNVNPCVPSGRVWQVVSSVRVMMVPSGQCPKAELLLPSDGNNTCARLTDRGPVREL